MSGERVAVDNSVAIDVLAGQADNILSTCVSKHFLPVPVNPRKAEENLAKVVARCRILNVTAATAVVYTRLRLALKQKGKSIRRMTSVYGPVRG